MAEGFAKDLGSDIMLVYSAGTNAYSEPKALALEVMIDIGIDMSHANSKLLRDIPDEVDILVTMGCGVECPYVICDHREDWGLADPSGGPKEGFEVTRDLIEEKVLDLISRVKQGLL